MDPRDTVLSSQLVPKLTRTLVSSYLLLVNSYLIFGQLVPVLVNSYLFWLTRTYFRLTRTLVNSYLSQLVPM